MQVRKAVAVAAAQKLAQAVESTTRSALEINSPSKVFKRIGYGIPEGFAMGVSEKAYLALDAVRSMTQQIQTTPEMRGEYSVTEEQKAEGYGKQYNIDQVVNIYSETDDVIETTSAVTAFLPLIKRSGCGMLTGYCQSYSFSSIVRCRR